MKVWRAMLVVFFILSTTSCGDGGCKLTAVRVSPAIGTANHLAAAPDNQVRFAANGSYTGSCAIAACVDCLPGVTWEVSDPANVSLAPSTVGISAIVATCTGATNGAVTITAKANDSGRRVTGTASLTCQ